jgi:hypothetical protein
VQRKQVFGMVLLKIILITYLHCMRKTLTFVPRFQQRLINSLKTVGLNRKKIYRGMEQLVARRAHNPKVTGSSPVPATTKDTGNGILFLF